MVIWLNGAFGVGKTSVARELVRLLPGSRIVDPERIGYVMRRTLWRRTDYQDVALWRRLVRLRVSQAARRSTVVVPMTVIDPAVLTEVAGGAHVVLLEASRTELESRIATSGEATGWRMQQLDRCLDAFATKPDLGRPVETDGRSPAEVAAAIAASFA